MRLATGGLAPGVVRGPWRAVVRHGWRGGIRTRSPRVSTRGFSERCPQEAPGGSWGGKVHVNLRHRAAVRLACLRPLTVNPALRAYRSHKKPPAEAGGLRVACLPVHHAPRVCTGESRAVVRHGRRGGIRTRSPRVSTRGFSERCPQEAPGGSWWESSREPAASCRSSLGVPPPTHSQPGPPGLALPQKAPGGSRGTPGGMPSRSLCAAGLHR